MNPTPRRTTGHATAARQNSAPSKLVVAFVAIVACALLPTVGTPVGAARSDGGTSISELQRERDQVRRQRAARASEVNALEASDAEVSSALAALNANVVAQQDRVEEAERAVAQATADQEAAEQAQARKEDELAALREEMKASAIEAYVTMGSNSGLTVSGSENVNDTVNKRTLLSMQATGNIDLVERFRAVQEELGIQRSAATEAAERARVNKAAVDERMAELSTAYEQQQAFAAQVERRLEAALAEADSLASIDSNLSSSINARQAEIARAVATQRAAEQARAQARAAQNRASFPAPSSAPSAPRGGGGGGGGGTPPAITGSGSIVSVGGIRVHQSIAGNLQRLLSAAAAAGIHFSGGGYRDPAGQIAVRRNNCGSSHYAIYEMPASQCRPPTARPGSSMHERGLAIDFVQNGSTLNRSSSGFNWLRANAASFGLYNLPSEPWHWSTNGN